MTNEQKQQIKARFFGAHIGCKVGCFDTVRIDGVISGIAPGNSGAILCYVKYDGGTIVPEFLSHCKLILRPLSSISDEEAAECAEILVYNDFKDEIRINYTKAALQMLLTLRIKADRHWSCADYLRSRNFALPFFGLDPIQEGWAVLESDKNSPKI